MKYFRQSVRVVSVIDEKKKNYSFLATFGD